MCLGGVSGGWVLGCQLVCVCFGWLKYDVVVFFLTTRGSRSRCVPGAVMARLPVTQTRQVRACSSQRLHLERAATDQRDQIFNITLTTMERAAFLILWVATLGRSHLMVRPVSSIPLTNDLVACFKVSNVPVMSCAKCWC